MSNLQLPIFQSSEERTDFIRDNADYFTITWRQGRKNLRLEYGTLKAARIAAQISANFLKRNVLIYGVMCPFSDVSEPYGYPSWIENIYPHKEA